MTRKELYAAIKKYNLQDTVKELYNLNFTNVPSDYLEAVIKEAKRTKKVEKPKATEKTTKKEVKLEDVNWKKLATAIVSTLQAEGVFSKDDVDFIFSFMTA